MSSYYEPSAVTGNRGKPNSIRVAEISTVNADGSVDLKPLRGRGGKAAVGVPAWYVPSIGDRVLIADLDGNPLEPVVLGPLAPRDGAREAPAHRFATPRARFFRAYRTAVYAPTVGGGVTGAILFDTETDDDGLYDIATGRFTPPAGTTWSIGFGLYSNVALGAPDRYWQAYLRKNHGVAGARDYRYGELKFQRGAFQLNSTGTAQVTGNGTDFYDVRLSTDNGTTGLLVGNEVGCYFEVQEVL